MKLITRHSKDDIVLDLGFEPTTIDLNAEHKSDEYSLYYTLFGYEGDVYEYLGVENEVYFFRQCNSSSDRVLYSKESPPERLLVGQRIFLSNDKIPRLIYLQHDVNPLDIHEPFRITDLIERLKDNDTLTKKMIQDEADRINKEDEERNAERQAEAELKRKEEEVQEKNWNDTGSYKMGDISAEGNVLKFKQEYGKPVTMTTSMPVKNIITLNELTNKHLDVVNIVNNIINIAKDTEGDVLIEIEDELPIKIHIQDRNTTFNGTEINKGKVLTVLRNRGNNTTEMPLTSEKIKALNDLGLAKQNLIKEESIRVQDVNVPVTFLPADENGDLFTVSVMGNETKAEWSLLKDLLGVSTVYTRMTLTAESYFSFLDKIGFDRAKAIQIFSEAKMLKSL